MTLTPEGGAAIPVSVTTTRKVQGGSAIPVYGYMTAPTDGRPALGGAAVPVRVLTAADLKVNGGQWTLEGRHYAMPVYTAPATTIVQGGPAIAVYPVNAWPTVPVVPAWAPTDIAGLQLWLDSADATTLYQDSILTTPATADNHPVGGWKDKSGNSNHALQATAANRLILKTSVTNAPAPASNVIRSDGTTLYFTLPSGNTSLNITGDLSIYAVLKTPTATGNLISLGNNTTGLTGYILGAVTNKLRFYSSGNLTWVLQSTANYFNSGHPHIISVVLNGTSLTFQVDGNAEGTLVSAAPVSHTVTRAINAGYDGTAAGTTADWYEILVYSGAHSAATRKSITDYLSNKYFRSLWQRQGTVLQATVPADESSVYEPTVIYEAGAQILSGTVFKMWYSDGWGNQNICYAESTDGKSWTKYASNPVLAGYYRSSVIKVGSTYYLYANGLQQRIDLYTSADGITFALDTANALVRGAGGAWDDTNIANCSVWYEGAGDWRMLYDGNTGAGPWKLGYATSTDGKTWTKHASNPVISETGTVGSPYLRKVGSTFYCWCLHTPSGTLPTDLERYQSTDCVTWTKNPSSNTFSRWTTDEGIGLTTGQVADPTLLEVNGTVYLYYAATSDGTTSSQHIKLATAAKTFAELVTTNEGF